MKTNIIRACCGQCCSPRCRVGPKHTEFFVGSFGPDSIVWQKAVFWFPVMRCGSNFTNNYRLGGCGNWLSTLLALGIIDTVVIDM